MTTDIFNVLERAQSLIHDPKNWTTGAFARTKDGNTTQPCSKLATCFCSEGAVSHVAKGDYDTYDAATNLLAKAMNGNIAIFNDRHTHAEVMEAFDKARELANESSP